MATPFVNQFRGNPQQPQAPQLPGLQGSALDRPAYAQSGTAAPQQPQAPANGGFDMNAIMQAMMLMSQNSGQQRLQGQREFLGDRNRHLDISGNLIDPYANKNPFDNGFFNSSASQLSPEQRAASQGGNAMNQWADPIKFNGTLPPQQSAAESAMQASPAPFQISPQSQQMLGNFNAFGSAAGAPQPRQARKPRPKQGYTPSWNPTVPGARMA